MSGLFVILKNKIFLRLINKKIEKYYICYRL